MSDLWVAASIDIEAENAATELTLAKMATASIWPFLALAHSPEEFGHRLALAEPQIDVLVSNPVVRDQVLASFREDFQAVASLQAEAAVPDSVEELRKQRDIETLKQREDAEARGEEYDPSDEDWRHTGAQFFHAGLGRWVAVEAPGTPEGGPATGIESYHFPTAAPDPVDPINGEFPLQPQPWTVPPDKAWVERPMQFNPPEGNRTAGTRVTAAPIGNPVQTTVPVGQGSHYTDEGVETGNGPNPNYFSGGGEGIAGDQQSGFPLDVSLPEENGRVEWYGNASPQPVTAAKDNHGVCADGGCGRPVYRSGDQWHHLDGNLGHPVLLHSDHPWVQQRLSVRHTAPGGGEHAPYRIESGDGGYYVVNDKGERKNKEPKSKEDAREFQKALYKNVPGARESAEEDEERKGKTGAFHDPFDPGVRMIRRADVSSSDMGTGQTGQMDAASAGAASGAAPNLPPSMVPGGPGTEAMPPQTIPNASVSTNPFASGGGSGSPMPSATGMRRQADEYRGRPTTESPSGVADEYDSNTWEGPARQRPMQDAGARGINTPQRPREPIPQLSSSELGRREEPDEEDEDE